MTPCTFALIFLIFETVGGYFYDFGELSFFIVTLFPMLATKLGNKKSFFALTAAIILSGLVYLNVKSLYAGNLGRTTAFNYMFRGWTNTEITMAYF